MLITELLLIFCLSRLSIISISKQSKLNLKQYKEFLKDGNKLPEPLLQNKILNIDEQFIKEAYLSSSKIIRYYQLLSTITKLDDDGISLVKNLYLKNITKN